MWFCRLFSTAALELWPAAASASHMPASISFLDASGFSPPSWFHGPWCERFSKSRVRAALANISARFVQCLRSVPSSASCTPGWCAHRLLYTELLLTILIVKVSSHCLHRDVISAGKFRWLASSKEPALFFKAMWMATWALLHVANPSLAPSGLVPGINDNLPQVCVPSNPVLWGMSISLPLISGPTSSTGEMWSRREKMRLWRLKTGFLA